MKPVSTLKVMLVFIRVFIVVIAFTMDVKVRADVMIQSVSGQVEFEKNGQLISGKVNEKIIEPLEIETFGRSVSRVKVGSVELGLGENSLATIEGSGVVEDFVAKTSSVKKSVIEKKLGESVATDGLVGKSLVDGSFADERTPTILMSHGLFFVAAPQRDGGAVILKTPHGVVRLPGGECVVEINSNKTKVSVVSGSAVVTDRAASSELRVVAGYSLWQGGLLAQGARAKGGLEPLDLSDVLIVVKNLSSLTADEWQHRYDVLRPLWRRAVESVAQQNQDQVIGDMQIMAELRESARKKELAHARSAKKTRDEFRAHFLIAPSIGKEDPSSSVRDPASSEEN